MARFELNEKFYMLGHVTEVRNLMLRSFQLCLPAWDLLKATSSYYEFIELLIPSDMIIS